MTVDDIKNFQCCNHSDILAIPPPISSSKPVLQQYFECEICKVLYKTKRAIDQFKADLVHIIGSKLKEHFKQSGKQSLSFPCLESLFFGVFEGYIHYFNYKSGSYKCFFQGPDTYTQLATLLNNQNWGRKYFDNNQQTFVLLFNGQAEEKVNCNLFEEQILKYRKKRSNLPKLTVEWKTKSKRDAKDNQTSAGYIHLSFYTQQI
ncbi:hypothetical protein RhiirC2_789304 [Rhizophagus irregularis]|uniref:Uncharacterized protein n=1 Tax=Rhizophagus irregularis TaxID=588596 RepID=A0A2N1MND5_9GLOM|nr:hypothetical protein RhiirC2_789304 [Rhizophagus irregularis]